MINKLKYKTDSLKYYLKNYIFRFKLYIEYKYRPVSIEASVVVNNKPTVCVLNYIFWKTHLYKTKDGNLDCIDRHDKIADIFIRYNTYYNEDHYIKHNIKYYYGRYLYYFDQINYRKIKIGKFLNEE